MVRLSNKWVFRYSLGLALVWLGSVAFVWMQITNMRAAVDAVEEVGNKIEEVHAAFSYKREQRIQKLDEISLNVQLIYALRIQLEATYVHSFFAPDITQFLHVTDRYIDSVKTILQIDSRLSDLVAEVRRQRLQQTHADSILTFALLGSYISEATLSNSTRLSPVFKDIDNLVLLSNELEEAQRVPLQKLLAQSAVVLGQNAEVNHLVNQVSTHEVYAQQSWLEEQYHHIVLQSIVIVIAVSGLCFLGLLWLLYWGNTLVKSPQQSAENEVLHVPTETLKERLSSEAVQTEERPEQSSRQSDTALLEQRTEIDRNRSMSTTAVPQGSEELPPIKIDLMMDSLSGDEESVQMLLSVFVQDHADEHSNFVATYRDDPETAQRIVHSLKGVAASLGADALRKVAMEIESSMKHGHEPTEQQLQQLKECIDKTVAYANRILNREIIISS
ncbi:Hpt domain-containing protein [Vibrio vulnificus]|uniref:Hpt domain-containing protein n=1 Tax=Vibrio vulnificus TaxID=672 RepID=UPI004059ED59|nr:Hpt domain-containing protein [Vibrio vulnificus]